MTTNKKDLKKRFENLMFFVHDPNECALWDEIIGIASMPFSNTGGEIKPNYTVTNVNEVKLEKKCTCGRQEDIDKVWSFISEVESTTRKEVIGEIENKADLIKLHNRAGDFLAGQIDFYDKFLELLDSLRKE